MLAGVEAFHWCGNDGAILQQWMQQALPISFIDLEPKLRYIIGAKNKANNIKRASLEDARRKYNILETPQHIAYDDTLVLYKIAKRAGFN